MGPYFWWQESSVCLYFARFKARVNLEDNGQMPDRWEGVIRLRIEVRKDKGPFQWAVEVGLDIFLVTGNTGIEWRGLVVNGWGGWRVGIIRIIINGERAVESGKEKEPEPKQEERKMKNNMILSTVLFYNFRFILSY